MNEVVHDEPTKTRSKFLEEGFYSCTPARRVVLYTMSGKKLVNLFLIITLASQGGFLVFIPLETGMNSQLSCVIYLQNDLMTL